MTEEVLRGIREPIIQQTLNWRKANKLRSTYIIPVMEGSPHFYPDGRIHFTISTTHTDTGRTSSDQRRISRTSLSVPTEKSDRVVRPGGGIKIVAVDYSGIQARAIGWESCDKALVESFWHAYDVHADWMRIIAEHHPRWVKEGLKALEDKDVKKMYRDKAKNQFVFPAFFGAQPKSISHGLDIPIQTIERVQDKLWERFPGIHEWHNKIIADYKELGYVQGLSGIRRRAPISPNKLINAPIQADEALVVCNAMDRLSESGDPRFQANMEIHDDLTFLLYAHEVDDSLDTILTEMLTVEFDWINSPLAVEVSIGDDWCNLEPVGEFQSKLEGGYEEVKKK